MRRLIRFLVTFVFFALLTTAITLGVLFYIKNNEVVDLISRNENLVAERTKLQQELDGKSQCDENVCPQMQKFVDSEQKIEFDYPSSWKLETEIKVGDLGFAGSEQGRVVTKLDYLLTKGKSELRIANIMIATGFVPAPFEGEDKDYSKLSDKLARVYNKTGDKWSYVTISECADAVGAANAPFCYVLPAPGFGSLAKVVTLQTADETTLTEADKIVLSAQD